MNWLDTQINRYLPCTYERGGKVLVSLGVLSALVYVFTSIFYRGEFHRFPGNLMTLTFLISAWQQRQQLKSDLIIRLLVLSVMLPLLLFAINTLIDFESAYKYKSLSDLSKLFFFLPLAWWLGGSKKAARNMLILTLLGFLMAILFDPALAQSIHNLWGGSRVDFHIHNAQHGALFFGLVFIISLIGYHQYRNESASPWETVFLFSACLVGLIGLVGTQTRAAYVGIFVCGFIAAVQAFRQRKCPTEKSRPIIRILAVSFILIALLAGFLKQVQDGRIARAQSDIYLLLENGAEQMPLTSTGIRVHSWLEAWEWIGKRPLTGWGRKARIDVIQMSDRFPDSIKATFGHLHNGYLEILIGTGFLGLIFITALMIALLKRIKSVSENHFYPIAFYGTVFFLVLNLFESFFFYWSGQFALSVIMAAGYSQYLAKQLTSLVETND